MGHLANQSFLQVYLCGAHLQDIPEMRLPKASFAANYLDGFKVLTGTKYVAWFDSTLIHFLCFSCTDKHSWCVLEKFLSSIEFAWGQSDLCQHFSR